MVAMLYDHAADGYFDTVFSGDTVNGVISTYYLNHDYGTDTANTSEYYELKYSRYDYFDRCGTVISRWIHGNYLGGSDLYWS